MNLKLVIGIILVTMVSLAGTAQAIVKVDDGDDTIVVSVTSTSSELQKQAGNDGGIYLFKEPYEPYDDPVIGG